MTILKTATVVALAAALANAQSANPGVGSNPKAEGATDEVTSNTGPNGYKMFLKIFHGRSSLLTVIIDLKIG
jgi:hypothetical protein